MNTRSDFLDPEPMLPNHMFAMLLIIGTELMFFGGLVSAYWVARGNAIIWPPIGQPRLPVLSTFCNTLLLLGSGGALFCFNRNFGRRAAAWLCLSLALGTMFVVLQGIEWIRLLRFGLTADSSVYGAFFYLIIGAHGAHALVGLLMLCACFFTLGASNRRSEFLQVAGMYWYLVVVIWPILYVLVYVL